MKSAQTVKTQVAVAPISINGASATATAVDSNGYGSLSFHITFGTMAADASACKIQECDTSGGSYADVTGAAFTVSNITAANAAGKTFQCVVNIQGARKRYYKPVITAGAGATLVSCIAIGHEALQSPDSVTERGVVEYLVV